MEIVKGGIISIDNPKMPFGLELGQGMNGGARY
jgi:hypothetical protein